MDGLIADFAVAGVPDPVPVVVKAIAREGFQRGGAGPEIVVNAGGDRLFRGVADGRPPLEAETASHVDVADGAVLQMLHGFQHAGVGSPLAAVLADAIVFFYGADELAAFEGVVRAGFFHVDVFAGLAGPDGHQRVPVIGSGDGDGVDFLVFEKLAHVDVGLGLGQVHFFDVADTLTQNRFIDVAERDDFRSGDAGKAFDVIGAAASDTADGYADAIVGAEDFAAQRECCRACGDGFAGGLQEFATFDRHTCRLCVEGISSGGIISLSRAWRTWSLWSAAFELSERLREVF